MDIAHILRAENESASGGMDYITNNLPVTVPYLTLLILATLTGTCGNVLVITAVLTNKNLKQVGNMFICNLAIADLCVSGFVNAFNFISVIEGEEWFSQRPGVCDVVATICLIACYCSLYSIGAVGFNRYVHICHHASYSTIFTTRKTLLYCLLLWLVSFLLELSNISGWGGHGFDQKTLTCLWDRNANYFNTLFVGIVGITMPLIVIFICYISIFVHVYRRKKRLLLHNLSNLSITTRPDIINKNNQESLRLARTLFIIFIVFAFCWAPYAIVIVADRHDTYPQVLHMFVILLAHVNSSCNAILYGVTNRRFRQAYAHVFCLDRYFPSLVARRSIKRSSGYTPDVSNKTDIKSL